MKKLISTENLPIILVLISATLLRFYNYPNLFVHFDEFSAFFRTGFKTFGELIQKGVVEPDTHPAGVQVFLNYWVQLFGDDMMLFKLPFVFMGIASVFVAYKIGALWFNQSVGLVTALFVGFTQYALTYTLFARPYASGLFFCLMMVWFWTRTFLVVDANRHQNLVGYIVFGALCAYTHYFALFLVAVVWLSGLGFINRKQWVKYFLAGLAIFVLFIPHLNIFFIQLGKGGVESWLAKPTPRFFVEYLRYILHFSLWMYVPALLLLLFSIVKASVSRDLLKKQLILFSWITVTYLVAYFYSVFRSAVLQYSVLLFTFPFLIMLVYSFLKNQKPIANFTIVIVFISASVYSLHANRHYFYLMYNSGYEQMITESELMKSTYGENQVTILINEPDKIKQYYFNRLGISPVNYHNLNNFETYAEFTQFLDTVKTNYLVLAGVGFNNPAFIQMAGQRFPYMIAEKNWFLCDWYAMAREPVANYTAPADEVVYARQKNLPPVARQQGPDYSHDEYIAVAEIGMDSIINNKNNLLNLRLAFQSAIPVMHAELITEYRMGNQAISWQSTPFNEFFNSHQQTQYVYHSVKLSDYQFNRAGTLLRVYIWNKGFESFQPESLYIETRHGNPYLYGLFEEIQP